MKRAATHVAISIRGTRRSDHMMDFLMLVLALVFFAAGIGYAYACEQL